MKIVKVNNLPQSLEADTIYLVKSSTAGLVEIYVTDSSGQELRHIPSSDIPDDGKAYGFKNGSLVEVAESSVIGDIQEILNTINGE